MGDDSDFLARPRAVAIREFAPGNILYYEGSKFQITKTQIPSKELASTYQKVTVCYACGYFHDSTEENWDVCENCGSQLDSDRQGNPATLNKVIRMDTAIAYSRDRITCDEEERLKYGYNITTHFRFDRQRCQQASVISSDGTVLLKLTYGDASTILRINRGLRCNAQGNSDKGFKLDPLTGEWGDSKTQSEPSKSLTLSSEAIDREVYLMVEEVCNILLIEPQCIPNEEHDPLLASLQYALERSMQTIYKLEENELSSERLGKGKHLLFWESAEGGAGVLSQLFTNPKSFQKLADASLDICHFKDNSKDDCAKACYECLLSYTNQFDHPLLDRHTIQPLLNQLLNSSVETSFHSLSRDKHYKQLREKTDPQSNFEREFLDELYRQGIRLPDAAQAFIPGANVKPDFIYQNPKIAIFCDGSVHDSPDQQARDQLDRDNLRNNYKYIVISVRYNEDWRQKLSSLRLSF
jgi:hypothetical protein